MKIKRFYTSLSIAVSLFFLSPVLTFAQVNSQGESLTDTSSTSDYAVDGYCPVCIMKGDLVKGNPKYTATYKGKKYMFDTNEDKKMFQQNPDLYTQGLDLKYQQMKK
jgi:YHS domain-containing protein